MFSIRRPKDSSIRRFLESQRDERFSYPDVGATLRTPPPGYVVDHNRVQLGSGATTLARGAVAISEWKMFDLGWVELCWPSAKIEPGTTVGVLARAGGLFVLNAARIVAVIREETPKRRFGFSYGTLPSHVERGEERFTVEMDPSDGSVWYDILAFSRPNHWAVHVGYPLTRHLQKRFARDSMAAMRRAVGEARAE